MSPLVCLLNGTEGNHTTIQGNTFLSKEKPSYAGTKIANKDLANITFTYRLILLGGVNKSSKPCLAWQWRITRLSIALHRMALPPGDGTLPPSAALLPMPLVLLCIRK